MTQTNPKLAEAPRPDHRDLMRQRQRPLMKAYREDPAIAWIIDGARTSSRSFDNTDPVHGELIIGTNTNRPLTAPLAVHSAVGGEHDGPNPGDYISAALCGCVESTMRLIANRMGVELQTLNVSVRAEIDVRGTLCVDPDVPVGFQRMTISAEVRPAEGTPPEQMDMLWSLTEHCCVILQTLRNGVEVELEQT